MSIQHISPPQPHQAQAAYARPQPAMRSSVAATIAVDGTSTTASPATPAEPSAHIHLSPEALQHLQAGGSSAPAQEAEMPDALEKLLEMIRQLKEQLSELSQRLQALMADTSLTPEDRALQAQQLQGQMHSVNGALATAMGQLLKLMKDMELSQEQSTTVASLLS